MSEISGKCIKRYVDHPEDISQLTRIFQWPGHSSDECKVLGDFGNKYDKFRPTKDHRQETETKKKFGRQKYNNYIAQNAVDEIILQEKKN